MIEINNPYFGANFSHTGQNCTATGDYRVENGALKHVNISGSYTKDENVYGFSANRDEAGNVNISGVAGPVLTEVAVEVSAIIAEVEAEVGPKEAE